jgi:hypothetical protein
MAVAFNQLGGDYPSFGGSAGVRRRPAVSPNLPVDPSARGRTPPRANPTLTTLPTSPAATPAPQAPQVPQVQRPSASQAAPSAPTLPSAPAMTGAPQTGGGNPLGLPPHLMAALTGGQATTQFPAAPSGPAPSTSPPTPSVGMPPAGQHTQPSAPPQVERPQPPPTPQVPPMTPMSPQAAATPAQALGGGPVTRPRPGGLLGAAGGLLEGGLGVPGGQSAGQAIPTELLALLARQGGAR